MIILAWGRGKHSIDVDRLIQHELRARKAGKRIWSQLFVLIISGLEEETAVGRAEE